MTGQIDSGSPTLQSLDDAARNVGTIIAPIGDALDAITRFVDKVSGVSVYFPYKRQARSFIRLTGASHPERIVASPVFCVQGVSSSRLCTQWSIPIALYQAVKQQVEQDKSLQDLVERLREMVGLVVAFPDLRTIPNTTDVIKKIGNVTIDISRLIDEYARQSSACESHLITLLYIYNLRCIC